MNIETITEKMGAQVYGGTWTTGELWVGAEVSVERDSKSLGNAHICAVLVDNKLLDHARPGDNIQVTLKGPGAKSAQLNDVLRPLPTADSQ
jgi:hypothetical protein